MLGEGENAEASLNADTVSVYKTKRVLRTGYTAAVNLPSIAEGSFKNGEDGQFMRISSVFKILCRG